MRSLVSPYLLGRNMLADIGDGIASGPVDDAPVEFAGATRVVEDGDTREVEDGDDRILEEDP